MEGFDDDEFSDLYADVVVQASSAISAMHRLTESCPASIKIAGNAIGGEKEARNGAQVAGGSKILHENGAAEEDCGGGGLTLLMESGDISGSASEDDLDNGGESGDDGYEQKFDDNNKYANPASNVEFEVANRSKREGGGGIEGKEKSVKGGDYNSQGKKSCKKADADMGNRELCFRRDDEDNQLTLERKYGGPDKTSESCRPLDLDMYGSVQISDSVEDNHREVSDSDSVRMTEATETSYDTNRRKTSSISNKVSSSAESGSSESSWSRYGRGPSCSPSPSVALSDKSIEKSHKHSKYPSSSLARESQEMMTRKHYPSRDLKSRDVRRSTSYDRHCVRQRDNSKNYSNKHKNSNAIRCLKTRQTDKDASYAIDVKRHYNRHIGYGRQRAMVSFNSYENVVPYRSQPERFVTYSGGLRPDHQFGPAYLKNQYWNTHPSCRYEGGMPVLSERHRFLQNKSSRMYNGAMEDDWYHNQRRHPVQGNIEGSRNFTPKYSSTAVNQRGTRFISRGDDMHFRMRTKGDHSSQLDEYDKKFVEGKYRRICPSGGRDRDHLDHRCDQNIAHNRREMESSRTGKRRHYSPLNNLDNLTKPKINYRRNIKHRPSPYYSSEEPCPPGSGQFLGTYGPESCVPERKLRCSWKEMHIESGRYGTNIAFSDTRESLRCHHSEDHDVSRRNYQKTSNTYFMNESIKDDHDEDNFVRGRHHQNSEALHSREEVYNSRQKDDTLFHSEEPSYHFEKKSWNNRADDRHAFGCVAELKDVREVNRVRSKMMREQDSSYQIDGYRKSSQPHSHAQMHPRYQDSIDHLVVVGRKCTMQPSRRTSEAEEDEFYGKHDLMGRNDDQKSEDLDDFSPEKDVPTDEGKVNVDTTLGGKNQSSKFSGNQHDESLDIEEGQIITEELQDLMKHVGPSENAPDGNREVQRLDDNKIREIMVKMERRRERFKEPITIGKDPVKTSTLLPDFVESGKAKLERPARKRRWAGI